MNALPALGCGACIAERQVLSGAEHPAQPYVIHRSPFFAVSDDVSNQANRHRCLTRGNPFRSRGQRFHEKRLRCTQIQR